MPSPLKKIDTHTFTDCISTTVAKELMLPSQARYILNCNIISSGVGNVGVVTNMKGNTLIDVELPEGINRVIGTCDDSERNNLYYAVWNSNGYHTWFRFNYVDRTITKVIQDRTDTGDAQIFNWTEGEFILHADISRGSLLYWVIKGDIARKIDIDKCLDKSDTGYGVTILEEYTRAYKKTSNTAPKPTYFTNTDIPFNRLYGYQFKFCVRFIYDNREKSHYSDYSIVPVPSNEPITGINAIPTNNNGIQIIVETGGNNVKQIEIAMLQTNQEGGVFDWVTIVNIDKEKLGISSNSEYTYSFYNDGTYPKADIEKIIKPHSYLPKMPLCQSLTEGEIVYTNFYEGFPDVDIDMSTSVEYSDLFIASGTENKMNNPYFNGVKGSDDDDYIEGQQTVTKYDGTTRNAYRGARFSRFTITIGNDVKKNNDFILKFSNSKNTINISYTATQLDSPLSVASQIKQKIIDTGAIYRKTPDLEESNIYDNTIDGGGNVSFSFIIQGAGDKYYSIFTNVQPVSFNSLKDTGESVKNIKMGSSFKIGITYEDEEGGRKSLVYTDAKLVQKISPINDFGKVQLSTVSVEINHRPPVWAKYYQIMRSADLIYGNYIQMLIQKAIDVQATNSSQYVDLIIGSLFTYQKLHENTTLKYNYTKGDRIRFIKYIDTDTSGETYYDFFETEIVFYKDAVTQQKDEEITVNGTAIVKVDGVADEDNVGSYLRVDGIEREIVSANDDEYTLSNTIIGGGDNFDQPKKYPYYEIINRNGTLRIKKPSVIDVKDYSVIEVFTPSNSSFSENTFYEFGQKYQILNYGTEYATHTANFQDQTDSQPAIVKFSDGTAYVRNREMPTNNITPNTQVLVTSIEDPSLSDFYVSFLNDNGRVNSEDIGTGEVHLGSRSRFSNNSIEDTSINGLNDFDNLDRKDYNDRYGDIVRTVYDEKRLYAFKELKTAWIPVSQTIITTEGGEGIVGTASKLLGNIQYFAWEGGIGGNPEAYCENGTQKYYISPNSGVLIRLGGNGETPISEIYQLDNEIRNLISLAQKNSSKIYLGFDRLLGNLIVSFEGSENLIFNKPIDENTWVLVTDEGTSFSIVDSPSHGTLDLTDPNVPKYTPDLNYVGNDSFTYNATINGVTVLRKECITVVDIQEETAWRGQDISAYCLTNDGLNTGYQGWAVLEEYYIFSGEATGNTKPNVSKDSDYIAPVFNSDICKPAKWVAQESSAYCKTTPDPKWVVDEDSASCVQEGAVLPDFDYVVIDYSWQPEAGSDLDTFTGLINTGTAYDNDWVGYGQGDAKVPSGSATPYLWFAGDNTSGGRETSLVDFNKFIADNPSVAELIKIRMNAVWFSGKLTGEISIGIVTYKGGTMSLDAPNHNFVNTGGVVVSTESIPVTVTFSSSSGDISNSQDLAILTYNKTTNSATLNLV